MKMRHCGGHGRGRSGFENAVAAFFAARGPEGDGWGGGFGRGFGGFGGFGGGRFGRRRMFDAADLKLVLLKLIAERPRHGYDLIQAISELTGGAYAPSPGVVYPALAMLEDQGLIVPAGSEGARKAFAIAEAGQAELTAHAEQTEALWARLGELAQMQSRMEAAPVRRAVHNLRAVLGAALERGGADSKRALEIAAILDAAAQQIERLA